MADRSNRKRILVALLIGALAGLLVYLVGAAVSAANRFTFALEFSKERAHTVIGREGYEYIFEPNTQILLDKIMPNQSAIVLHIIWQDYLPFTIHERCLFDDPHICAWMDILVFYEHDPSPLVRQILLVALIAGLITAAFVYVLSRPRPAAAVQT